MFSQKKEWSRHIVCSFRRGDGVDTLYVLSGQGMGQIDTLCVLSDCWSLNSVSPWTEKPGGWFQNLSPGFIGSHGHRELRDGK